MTVLYATEGTPQLHNKWLFRQCQ